MKEDVKLREYDKFRPADNEKSKVATVLEQPIDNPVPTYPVFGTPTPIFGETLTDPGEEVELVNRPTTEAMLRLVDVNVSCHIEGKAIVKVNDTTVATARTAPGKPDAKIRFAPFYELALGDVLTVHFKARPNSPEAEVETYANACNCT
jgi:hypothetical protein